MPDVMDGYEHEEDSAMALSPARGVVTPTEGDILSEQDVLGVREFQRFLHDRPLPRAMLVGDDGQAMEMPAPVVEMLRRVVPLLAEGAALGLAPLYRELTTQQAADFLNISRPSLIKLLAADEIPHGMSAGGHRRIRFVDVLAYKRRRSETRRAAFAEMAAIGEAYGADDTHADDGLFDVDADANEAHAGSS
jgi:excisionase family DNA binding protein